jgi:hypothetical protein
MTEMSGKARSRRIWLRLYHAIQEQKPFNFNKLYQCIRLKQSSLVIGIPVAYPRVFLLLTRLLLGHRLLLEGVSNRLVT